MTSVERRANEILRLRGHIDRTKALIDALERSLDDHTPITAGAEACATSVTSCVVSAARADAWLLTSEVDKA